RGRALRGTCGRAPRLGSADRRTGPTGRTPRGRHAGRLACTALGPAGPALPAASCSGGAEPLPARRPTPISNKCATTSPTRSAPTRSLTFREARLAGTEDRDRTFDPGSWVVKGGAYTDADYPWKSLVNPLNEVLDAHAFGDVYEFE